MTRMSDRRKDLRPREKLQTRGVAALSDYELLMAIIGALRNGCHKGTYDFCYTRDDIIEFCMSE